ncbi:MAG: serine/threonine protein kinase [Clostridia bacterium]|nr:serine/threonine protein kinase [Clostridia bacterium]
MDINYYKRYEPIGNKWHITRELGRGSYGVVYEVERKDFSDAKSAMKILSVPAHPCEVEAFRNENYELDEASVRNHFYSYVEEFVKEFQLMSKLRGHSNIVSYEDHDVIEKTDSLGWDIFIRMELLTPLMTYFGGRTPTEEDVIRLAVDMCEALEVCNKNKIIHRDIKPTNIFVSPSGSFKLGDFGVARTFEKASAEMSKKGTYTYMAPEVFKGEEYDVTVDIYSLGIVMYKLLNDNMEPFRTDKVNTNDESALVRRMKGDVLPPPAKCSKALASIILKACAYNASERYPDAASMKKDLMALKNGEFVCGENDGESGLINANPYDIWLSNTNVAFKSVDSGYRWRCPRCDMANQDSDMNCFVCGCSKSVYIPPVNTRDSFVNNLNDHHTGASVRDKNGTMGMSDINRRFRESERESGYADDKDNTGLIIALAILGIIFLFVLLPILFS